MIERKFKNVDRERKLKWPKGPWHDEADSYHWIDETTGYYCCIRRTDSLGHLCGYVGITNSHPYYGYSYESVVGDLDCHGGITYTGETAASKAGSFYVPVTTKYPKKLWMVGFDCGHHGDKIPSMSFGIRDVGAYKDVKYVKNEVEQLALQLAQLEPAVIAINKMKNEIGL